MLSRPLVTCQTDRAPPNYRESLQAVKSVQFNLRSNAARPHRTMIPSLHSRLTLHTAIANSGHVSFLPQSTASNGPGLQTSPRGLTASDDPPTDGARDSLSASNGAARSFAAPPTDGAQTRPPADGSACNSLTPSSCYPCGNTHLSDAM